MRAKHRVLSRSCRRVPTTKARLPLHPRDPAEIREALSQRLLHQRMLGVAQCLLDTARVEAVTRPTSTASTSASPARYTALA